ncbi:hypothetical protein CQW23_31256 [Capsicum baccatum]|uniref:TPX2 C-terminal domain-containing protein n=1 Tax=Capsicum baccatum TaxID=33114 RepID=A0A2G2V843_CAPBA|nr:hypothetical protein CQW23_31256 [Capsicum baccatum]
MNLEDKVEEMHQLQARTQELASKTKSSKSQSRPSTAGARSTSATENIVRCSRAEVYNRWSTNERLNIADSPQVSEATVHPSLELSDSSVPSSSPISKTSKQTQSNRTVAPKRAQEKRLVANSPRPRTSDCIKRNKDFKAEDKTKVVARRTGDNEMRKDVRSVDLSQNSWQSGSISFGRFENEALCWERRSSFTHNRYLKEVEKYYKTGSVTKKKAYFEELFRRKALLSQSSSDCQDGADFKQVMMDLRIQIMRGTLSMLMRFSILHALLKIMTEQPLQIST